jgi:hypothetical protein
MAIYIVRFGDGSFCKVRNALSTEHAKALSSGWLNPKLPKRPGIASVELIGPDEEDEDVKILAHVASHPLADRD